MQQRLWCEAGIPTPPPPRRLPENLHVSHDPGRDDLAALAILRTGAPRPDGQADREYFESDGDHPELILRAASTLGPGFRAIDYSSMADEGVVLWEANPHFSLPPWNRNLLPAERGLPERHHRLNDRLADFFRDLLGAE